MKEITINSICLKKNSKQAYITKTNRAIDD